METTYQEAMVSLRSRVALEDRPQQDTAAHAIEQAIQDETILACQAGTGVGKSIAGLIPAIVSGKRVLYSTATKVLQGQIYNKDLPFLAEHLEVPFTYATLKGWSNYLCHARLAEQNGPIADVIRAELAADPGHIADRESFAMDFTNPEWNDLTVTSEDCPGKNSCPFGSVCKPNEARSLAIGADVLVVNHSLLATDAVVQEMSDGGHSLVGPRDVVIVDEAHELDGFISNVLGEEFTEGGVRNYSTQLVAWSRRAGAEALLADAITDFDAAAGAFFGALVVGRLKHYDIVENSGPFEALLDAYRAIVTVLRSEDVLASVRRLDGEEFKKVVRAQRDRMVRQAENKITALTQILLAPDSESIRYVEENKRIFRGREGISKKLRVTPLSVAPWASENLWPLYATSVLISATILIDGNSKFVADQLGLGEHTSLDAGTPFDYKSNALLFVPTNIPEPTPKNKAAWTATSIEMTRDLVMASGGGALLLFTSNAQLKLAWDALVGTRRLPFECRRQGDETNSKLMDWFRNEEHGVLFATRSFFTGASFEGETCRLVVIDKLPFPVPTEPMFEARCEEIARRTGDSWASFNELTVPMMTLPLQQGFGRLIRTKTDRGVVAILDPRIVSKGYGKKIRRSLPPAKFTSDIADVTRFYQKVPA